MMWGCNGSLESLGGGSEVRGHVPWGQCGVLGSVWGRYGVIVVAELAWATELAREVELAWMCV